MKLDHDSATIGLYWAKDLLKRMRPCAIAFCEGDFLMLEQRSESESRILFVLLAALACAGPAGKEGLPGDAGPQGPPGPPGVPGVFDYSVMTPAELEAAKIAIQLTGIIIPDDGRPVVSMTVTERHGAGVKGLSTALVSWRFALLKLDPAGNGTAAGDANDNWVSYMASNDQSSASTEEAGTSGLTDHADGTYTYQFTKNVIAGPTGAGTTYEPSKVHRVIILVSVKSPNPPFTPVNIVKDFVPSTGADVTGQNEKVDQTACLECHTTFRAIAGAAGALGTGEFHGGARFDVRTCIACHNDQRRFKTTPVTLPDTPVVAADLTWPGDMQVMNNETIMNVPVFIHKIHMGERLNMTGMKNPPVANDSGGTYAGYERPYNVTFPQDVRNCVKCHRSPAPMAGNWKAAPSRRACGACHDDRSFDSGTPPPGRRGHSGGPQSNDNSCLFCHAEGASAGVSKSHVPVSPPNPDNIYLNPTSGTSNTNAAYVAAAGSVPPGASVFTYEVSSVSTWDDAGTKRPQIVFKIKLDAADVVFPAACPPTAPCVPPNAKELMPNFVGSPSVFFAYAVPQDCNGDPLCNLPGKATPADFNVTASAYIRNVLNGTSACSGALTATNIPTGDADLSGPDASGFYTLKAKCIVIPANATMLTGGIGYTYSLGNPQTDQSLDFANNNQPLTQISLGTPYTYTANASGYAGKGGLIVPATDVSMVATGHTARRAIVDNIKCGACHVSLGVGPDFHAGQRNDAKTCNFCHNPNRTSSAWSANMKDFVHSIHGAEKRASWSPGVKFTWHEKSPTQGYWQTTYPAVLNRCQMCHLDGTFDFSTDPMNAALPSMLPSTVGQGTYAPGSVHSPYVAEGPDYGAGFKFDAVNGVLVNEAASTTLIVSPIVAACSACHDSPSAVDHMQTNGGSFWESRSAAAAKQQGEQCLICHGPNRIAAISLVHTDKTP